MVSLFGIGNKEKDKDKKPGFLDRLKQAVASTKAQLVERIEEIVDKKSTLDASVLDELEATLITADLGTRTTQEIIGRLKQQISQGKLRETAQLRPAVEQGILEILQNPAQGSAAPKAKQPPPGMPTVIFVVGVNGVGKTTSIAKLAHFFKQQGRVTLLCAADTFRAAAKTRHPDLVIVDTAGRLHTKTNLMAELSKMCRIAAREIPNAPHEVLLVIDATTGQNGLQQARQFVDHGGATGIVLTKLDGTAKGGVVIAIARELGLPIQFVGVGEKIDDLLPFNPQEFVQSLFEA